jgi:hypothetical protein
MSSSLTLLVLSTISSARAADYTADGIDDLVIGVPAEADIGGVALAGAVQVLRGSSAGLIPVGNAFIHQGTAGVAGSNEAAEYFGTALGAGDIDGDGTDDLIVGAPGALIRSNHSGMVWRLELAATATTLTVASSQVVSQTARDSDEGDLFGEAITVADFDGDGYDDVVVGIPGEDIGTALDAGAVRYVPGSPTGLDSAAEQIYNQDRPGMADTAETSDEFGSALAAGDFDADGFADLAIGVPYEDWSGTDEGSVQVMYGSALGPVAVSPDDELWTAGEGSAVGVRQPGNRCGSALTVGDFDGDGYDDLAIGCDEYDFAGAPRAGAVLLVYGSAAGLDDSELWSRGAPAVIGDPEEDDGFGAALTAGDYDGDGYDDLAVGVPDQDIASVIPDGGIVQVLFGSSTGLTGVGNIELAQDPAHSVAGTPGTGERWGFSVASGDYNDDGLDDLVVGAPFDSEAGAYQAGVVNVFYGSTRGPSKRDDEWFHQNLPGIPDSAGSYDWFGFSVR